MSTPILLHIGIASVWFYTKRGRCSEGMKSEQRPRKGDKNYVKGFWVGIEPVHGVDPNPQPKETTVNATTLWLFLLLVARIWTIFKSIMWHYSLPRSQQSTHQPLARSTCFCEQCFQPLKAKPLQVPIVYSGCSTRSYELWCRWGTIGATSDNALGLPTRFMSNRFGNSDMLAF